MMPASIRRSRRSLLGLFGLGAAALPFARFGGARAAEGVARRLVVFYYPDGVAGRSQDGEPSLWHATGTEHDFALGALQAPLAELKSDCVFLNGLTLGPTDAGSHPGGAKKLLTAADGGAGPSIDQLLARGVGADAPFRHVYLGAHANVGSPSGDKHVSYVQAGQSVAPEDDPRRAFDQLFSSVPTGQTGGDAPIVNADDASVIDAQLAEIDELRARLGGTEKSKLDLHLESLRELEKRIKQPGGPTGIEPGACTPALDVGALSDASFYDPATFPDTLRAQIDVAVQAMACGLTRVGVIQASQHTSELIMSRFPGTEMYDPGFDMRSHQASHYGPSHDPNKRELDAFTKQVRYWTSQFAYLVSELKKRPEGDGTMLDHTIALLCTEVCDGNTHLHDDMPFVIAGGAGGRFSTGRLLDAGGRRHADLFLSIASAMGQPMDTFGDASSGPLPGLG